MPASHPRPAASDLLLEYQNYVMAYRLRAFLGGRLTPPGEQLPLSEYAGLRVQRQTLARQMITRASPPEAMRALDRLTDALMFGFWYNPAEVTDFLRAAIRQGGHPVLGSPELFRGLLTPGEQARLGPAGVARVCGHYLACFALASPGVDPHALEHIFQRIEALRPPLFLDELDAAARTA